MLLSVPAWAARPFVTDDARLTTAGSCQLESWMRVYPESSEVWALPACNPGGNLEVTLGGGLAAVSGSPATGDYVLQLKSLFRPLVTNGWGAGWSIGTVQHPQATPGPNVLGSTYAYLPVSVSFLGDQAIMHANVGWLRDKASNQDRRTWGLGFEIPTVSRLTLIVESFGDDQNRPFWQSGVRFAVVPNLFQIDATVGQQAGSDAGGRWLSLGFRWTPDRLF
jgi:hypothetical protein